MAATTAVAKKGKETKVTGITAVATKGVQRTMASVAAAAPKTVRIPINNVYGGGDYTAQLSVGSRGAIVNVIMDTGSSTLAVKIPSMPSPCRPSTPRP